jgi:hypothetical protein
MYGTVPPARADPTAALLGFGGDVGAVRILLQSYSVNDRDCASSYGNQVVFHQSAQRLGDGSSADTEHEGQELVCEEQLVAVYAIASATGAARP